MAWTGSGNNLARMQNVRLHVRCTHSFPLQKSYNSKKHSCALQHSLCSVLNVSQWMSHRCATGVIQKRAEFPIALIPAAPFCPFTVICAFPSFISHWQASSTMFPCHSGQKLLIRHSTFVDLFNPILIIPLFMLVASFAFGILLWVKYPYFWWSTTSVNMWIISCGL